MTARERPRFLKYPVGLWRDAGGGWTACTLDGEDVAVYETTVAGAMRQLKKTLAWRARRVGFVAESRFTPLETLDIAVPLRPSHTEGGLRYPGSREFSLSVPCVVGLRSPEVAMVVAPTLGLRLAFDHKTFKARELVLEAVRGRFAQASPESVSRELRPEQFRFASLQVRLDEPAARDQEAVALPALSAVAEPMLRTGNNRRWPPAWSREALADAIAARLDTGLAPLLLVGEAGVGKTTLLANAFRQLERARKKRKGEPLDEDAPAPPAPWMRRAWITAGARIISGMQYLGQWEERCEAIVAELASVQGVLCVENLLEWIRVGGADPAAGVGAFFAPYLQRGELRMVAETTPEQLDACRRLLPGLVDLFDVITIPRFRDADARDALTALCESYGCDRKVVVAPASIDWMLERFRRFRPYLAFPGRTAAFARELIEEAHGKRQETVDVERVREKFGRETGLPEIMLRDDQSLSWEETRDWFAREVISQPEAAERAADAVVALKAGLNDAQRPIGVFFFCGPTGVGKTEMAKAIARWLFGAGDGDQASTRRLVRLDMSEYAEPGASERLVQQTDGEPSAFIKRMRLQPFSVVLLDELEKASDDVHDALLGLMDEGRLTDRLGRVTHFTSSLIVMTSNVGAERPPQLGFAGEAGASYRRELAESFRPEFLNRIDAIVTFHPLDEPAVRRLAERELTNVAKRESLVAANLRFTWTPAALDRVVALGHHPRYGARPMQRTIEQEVVATLARWLSARPGASRLHIELDVEESGRFVVRERP